MKKAIILARVSTKRQEKDGLSLDEIQLPILQKYADETNLKVADVFRFSETADSKIRKKFHEMIEYVKDNKIEAIVSYRVDRITRNFRDQVMIDTLMTEYDIEIHCVQDRLVLTKETAGRDIADWDTKVFLAKMFLNRVREDGLRTKQTKLENGELPGKATYGYVNHRISPRETTVLVRDFESGIVKKMFELMASQAYSIDSMLLKLKNDYGLEMNRSQASRILHNRFYIGKMLDRKSGILYDHKYDTFIEPELFERVQTIMDGRNRNSPKQSGKVVLYRGFMRCESCGCGITHDVHERTQKNGNHHRWVYYHCTQRRGKHGAKPIEESRLTKQFSDLFSKLVVPQEHIDKVREAILAQNQTKSQFMESEMQSHNTAITKLQNRISRSFEVMLDGSITQAEYSKYKQDWDAQIQFHRRKLETMDDAGNGYYDDALALLEICRDASNLFEYAELEEKRELIGFVCQNLLFDGKKVKFNLLQPFDDIYAMSSSNVWQG